MKAVVIFSLLTQFVFSQQQQQQFLANNISNFTSQNDNNRGNINPSNIIQGPNIISTNKPKSLSRPLARVKPINMATQVSRINTNKSPITAQAQRARSRSRSAVQSAEVNHSIKNVSDVNISNMDNFALGNEFNLVSQMINTDDSQVQGFSNWLNESNPLVQQQTNNLGNQFDNNIDLSLNLKGLSIIKKQSSASSTSSYYNARVFSKKIAKFKRNFLGKLSSHKKSKHRLDVCFNWKK